MASTRPLYTEAMSVDTPDPEVVPKAERPQALEGVPFGRRPVAVGHHPCPKPPSVANRAPASRMVAPAGDPIPLFTGMKPSRHQVTFQEVLGLAAVGG